MSVLVIMIPLSLILVIGAGIAFFWAVNHDQFDDMQTPSLLPMSDNLPRHQASQVDVAVDADAQSDAQADAQSNVQSDAQSDAKSEAKSSGHMKGQGAAAPSRVPTAAARPDQARPTVPHPGGDAAADHPDIQDRSAPAERSANTACSSGKGDP